MKRITIIYFLLFSLFVLNNKVEAQSGRLGVTSIANLPDTVYEGTAYDSILVYVTNLDTTPYQGSIELLMLADSSNFPVSFSQGAPAFQVSPGDSVLLTVNNYFFDPAAFKEGDNIVVVWPIANVSDVDSFYVDVYYMHLSSATENQTLIDNIYLYPNPAGSKVEIFSSDRKKLEQVRIYDSKGKLVYEKKDSLSTIDLDGWAPGIYSLFIFHREGVSIKKLLKH